MTFRPFFRSDALEITLPPGSCRLLEGSVFIRVGGETRSHRSAGSKTPVLAPVEPEP